MRKLTICFVAREDFVSKPGGDTVQWHIYEAAVKAAGMQCLTWFDDQPMPRADVFHALNVDRPLELYPKMREVRRRGLHFVLSTIHHPIPWVERFRQVEPPGGRLGSWLYRSPIGRSLAATESLKEVVRLVRQKRLTHLGDLIPSWTARVRWLLQTAGKVMLLAPEEEHHLRTDFDATWAAKRTVVVPNWIEGVGEHRPCGSDPIAGRWAEAPVLVVGRIEARKNVRRIARLAERMKRPTIFLGKPNPNEPAYVAAFEQTVHAAQWVRWVPGIPRDELASYYYGASFLLNGSYVEVSPMVDLEALLFGCPVATTRYALHHSILPNTTPKCDAYDDQDIQRLLDWRPQRQTPAEIVSPGTCRDRLLSTYQEVAALAT